MCFDSFIGDDVMRQVFRKALLEVGINLFGLQAVPPHLPRSRKWNAGRDARTLFDHVLSMKGGTEHQIWFSYQVCVLSLARLLGTNTELMKCAFAC